MKGHYPMVISCLTLVVIIVAIIAVMVNANQSLNEDCTYGFLGTAASVELHGEGAIATCNATVQSAQATQAAFPDGGPTGTGSAYLETGTPQGAEICSGTWGQLTYTVRDSGLFNLTGNDVCTWFESQVKGA